MSRAFLVQIPHAELVEVCAAIGKPQNVRAELARRLAVEAMPHLRRVAASERVIGGVDGPVPERWAFASTQLPYLASATTAADITARLAMLGELADDDALEAWFVEEAALLGVTPSKLSRAKYRAPSVDEVATWCHDLFDALAMLRSQVLGWSGSPQQRADYAITTWVYLAWIFRRLRPAFCQGRVRSLGAATVRLSRGTDKRPAMAAPGLFSRLVRRPERASSDAGDDQPLPGLRELMISTADLVPSLGMGTQRESLPIRGSAGLATAAVPAAHTAGLAELFASADVATDWRTLVVAAAHAAHRTGAHLVEADDARPRWPVLPHGDAAASVKSSFVRGA
jgi:hypothetical protein